MRLPGKKWRERYAGRHEPEVRSQIARNYWLLLASLLCVIVFGSVGYGAWEFTQPLGKKASEAVVGAPKPILKRADLQQVLNGFDARATRFDELRAVRTAIPDPS